MIRGTIDEISISPRITEWIVPDYFKLSSDVGFCVYSPEFLFWNYRCRLAAQPNGSPRLPGIMLMALYGVDRNGINRWEMEIRRSNDTVLRKCSGWKEDGEEMVIRMYIPTEEAKRGWSDKDFFKVRCTLYCVDPPYLEGFRREKCENRSSQTEEVSRFNQISCDIEEMLLREDFTDLIIKVEDKEYKVHKSILGVRSPVFTSMFKYKMTENITGIVEIDDCDAVTFREFIRYLYSGRISKFSPEILFKLHQVADKYQVKELKAHCLDHIKNSLSVDSFCEAIALSLQHDEEELMDTAMNFFSENMTEVKNSEKWQNFESENPEEAGKLIVEALRVREIRNANSKDNFLQKIVGKFKSKKIPEVNYWRSEFE